MDIQADINWMKSELDKVKDPSFVQALKSMFTYRSKQQADWWDEISAEEKAEIEEGIQQIQQGDVISHQQVMENPRKWG